MDAPSLPHQRQRMVSVWLLANGLHNWLIAIKHVCCAFTHSLHQINVFCKGEHCIVCQVLKWLQTNTRWSEHKTSQRTETMASQLWVQHPNHYAICPIAKYKCKRVNPGISLYSCLWLCWFITEIVIHDEVLMFNLLSSPPTNPSNPTFQNEQASLSRSSCIFTYI